METQLICAHWVKLLVAASRLNIKFCLTIRGFPSLLLHQRVLHLLCLPETLTDNTYRLCAVHRVLQAPSYTIEQTSVCASLLNLPMFVIE